MNLLYGEYPPNYEAIADTFDIRNNDAIVFTFGNDLYIPAGNPPDAYLIKHEETHAKQQTAMGIESWWERYLIDAEFRFAQELDAYRTQYKSMGTLSLEQRIGYLNHIATDLSGAMYGHLMTFDEAKAAITKDIVLKTIKTGGRNMRKLKKLQRQNRKRGRR